MPPRKTDTVASPSSKPAPRAEAIARTLATAILDGTRPVGTLLPADSEIAAAHGASAATVRAALRRLEALGLIVRQRGSDARVISGEVRASYLIGGGGVPATNPGGAYAGDTQLLIERERQVLADAELAMLLGVREGSGWLHVTGVRLPDDADFGPISWVDAWLDSDASGLGGAVDLTAAGIAALTGATVADLVESFSAAALTPAQARHLRARGGTACLHIVRRYLRANGSVVAVVRDVHPAERVSVTVRLTPA